MKTNKFARRPFYVDAVRVSDTNIEEVAAWCGGEVISSSGSEGTYIKVEVHRPLTSRQTQAFFGCWVLRSGNGFKVYEAKAFDKSFEKVKVLTKPQADAAGIVVPHEPRAPKGPIPTPPKTRPVTAETLVAIDPMALTCGHEFHCFNKQNLPDWSCTCTQKTKTSEAQAAEDLIQEVLNNEV